ncbi:MAG: M23 family metallopeptidase [Opitutaceae bacterium]|nr:M23 family metallopeptidase [Opitutaceae bacterium]
MRMVLCLAAILAVPCGIGAQELIWPTPRPALHEGRPHADYIQPTESGTVESGMFGCTRTSGRQFHEGLDLKALNRDRRGEATDPVVAVAPGVVRHVNSVSGRSNYGRYVVVEHTGFSPAVITLYAHLGSIAPDIQPGAQVQAGTQLGIMGRSASTGIPRERAHLHIEIGFWLGRGFQAWYERQKYPSKNEHGTFNGMNVVSMDFLDFMEQRRRGVVQDLRDYIQTLPTAATVVVKTRAVPDFVQRYPDLVQAAPPATGIAGWRIEFTWFGLPKAWWPLDASEAAAVQGTGNIVVFHDRAILERYPCQSIIRTRGGVVSPGPKMQDVLEIIFTAAR